MSSSDNIGPMCEWVSRRGSAEAANDQIQPHTAPCRDTLVLSSATCACVNAPLLTACPPPPVAYLVVCDPVMGDDGRLYIKPELVPVYRERVRLSVWVLNSSILRFFLISRRGGGSPKSKFACARARPCVHLCARV